MKQTTTLFRPVGLKELELIFKSGMDTFPPRLPEQPIFYPVLNKEYAAQIAKEWNAKADDVGFVLEFDVDSAYLSRFKPQIVGGKQHEELWVPAKELAEFNEHIIGKIRLLEAFKGMEYKDQLDCQTLMPLSWNPGLSNNQTLNKEMLEKVAAAEHEQWSTWAQHFLENQTPENLLRWKRQLATPYDLLTEEEKEVDRHWARKVAAVLEKAPGLDENVLHEGRFLRMKKTGKWEYVERTKTSGIVGILAVTPENKLLLVEQFRPPLGKKVIEIPAGLAGDIKGSEHEALAVAAQRELLEETGYEAKTMLYLTEGPASAGLSTEVISFFQALELKKVEAGGGDASESIVVHEIPLEGLEAWLEGKRTEGCLIDYKIYTALYFLKHNTND